jgi:ribosome biogenesis GTPase
VFNKIDLYDKSLLEIVDSYCVIYQHAGYKCLTTSVPDNIGMVEFGNILKNKVTLLSGHSGVGKSALINKIDPKLRLREGNISDYHQKGKHTTTFAEMFVLSNGGFIIDTPGIKEFGLVGFELTELGQRFPEIRDRMHLCRFNNCLHVNEPGCAVIADFEKGLISESRYGNYLNMLNDLSEERN